MTGLARVSPARPDDHYPGASVRIAVWNAQYNPAASAAGQLDLHEIFRIGHREAFLQLSSHEELTGTSFVRNLP